MSYPTGISFPRNVLTTVQQRWVKSCLPWQLASGCPCQWPGCRSSWQLVVSPSRHRVCGFCLYSFLMPLLSPFKLIKCEPNARNKLGFSSCPNHKWTFRIIPFFGYSVCCYLTRSSLSLFRPALPTSPCPISCKPAVPAWCTQLGKWTSRPQPVAAGLWPTYTVQWLKPWLTWEVNPLTAPQRLFLPDGLCTLKSCSCLCSTCQ